MSYENKGKAISLIADAAYTSKYIAVKKNAVAEQFTVCSAGDIPVGILQDPTPANKAAAVLISGVSFVEASDAIAAGAAVATANDGLAVTAGVGVVPFGIALNAASAKGDIISVLLKTAGNPAAAIPPSVLLTYKSADLAAGADIAGDILGAAPMDGALKSAKIVSTGAAAGIDGDNTSKVEIKVGTTVLASKTFDAEVVWPAAGASVDLTLAATPTIEEDDVILLAVTNGATADLPAFVLQLEIG